MKRHILIYGVIGGILITLLKLIEFRFLVIQRSLEIYGGLVAAIFAGLGIWLGFRLVKKEQKVVIQELPVPMRTAFLLNKSKLDELGITPRELEILEWIAKGLTNREIAERLFVSENTVKTHSSRVFDKLNAKRRTQAVLIAKDLGLIP
jgi:DNA-binding CsgD family transcriptional regulator